MKRLAVLLLATLAVPLQAAAPPENPAVDTRRQAPPEGGTTLMGEGESDVGLYLTPWKEEHADSIDPPPGLYSPPLTPVDPRGFARHVRDAATVEAYRRQQLENFR
jgi:hypothetical protein